MTRGLCRENKCPPQAMNTLPPATFWDVLSPCRVTSGISQASQMATGMGEGDGPAGQAG